jgi:hypothetical protein
MRAMRLCVVLALAGTLVASSGCIATDDPEERRVALGTLVEALELGPMPGDHAVSIGETQSKNDSPYFTGTGVLEESRESGIARVRAAFEREGWEVFESGDVGHFLGSCVRARSGSMIAIAHVGWSVRPDSNPYRRLPGYVYVQTSVGKEGSNQVWTDPDRPTCGA